MSYLKLGISGMLCGFLLLASGFWAAEAYGAEMAEDAGPLFFKQEGQPDPAFKTPVPAMRDPQSALRQPVPASPRLEPLSPDHIQEGVRAARPVNPTAPNIYTQYLSGDFTDTDGDGMTDVAEKKYGYDHTDPDSFPAKPPAFVATSIPAPGIGLDYVPTAWGVVFTWDPPQTGSYALKLEADGVELFFGGHQTGSAEVQYAEYGLNGTETLAGTFSEYDGQGQWVQDLPLFTLDLSQVQLIEVGATGNHISYTFKDFPEAARIQYDNYLIRLWPLLEYHLGPPAESLNIVITNMGSSTGYFMITNKGRTFLTDTSFIPRLIAHELVHAWKGGFLFTSDEDWNYSPLLTGFEEATAEGMAFMLMHEYVRSYPDDEASIELMSYKPYQYWSAHTIDYDAVRRGRCTAGGFWDPNSLVYAKYSIAATTWQLMALENPQIYKQILSDYYADIRADDDYRPSRAGLLALWTDKVPEVLGVDTPTFLSAMPVFDESLYEEGVVVLATLRPYGTAGDQQFAATYANKDGLAWWGILKNQIGTYDLPGWIRYMDSDPPDNYYYINTQGEDFSIQVLNARREKHVTLDTATEVLEDNGLGYGWKLDQRTAMEDYPSGLYKEIVCFDTFAPHDSKACESFFFFGLKGYAQDKANDYVIMVGVDTIKPKSVSITVDGQSYTQPVTNGMALFRSTVWPFDLEEVIEITVTDASGQQQTYKRGLLEAGTYWEFFQQQFIITDRDFDGVEDLYQVQEQGVSTRALTFSGRGGQDLVEVRVADSTAWTAVSNAGWLTVLSGANGTGDGAVVLEAARNNGGVRTATITVAGETITVSQDSMPGSAYLYPLLLSN